MTRVELENIIIYMILQYEEELELTAETVKTEYNNTARNQYMDMPSNVFEDNIVDVRNRILNHIEIYQLIS